MKVLLVEDNELTRKLTAELLKTAGHEVIETSCAEEVDWTTSGPSGIPEVAVIDVCLPRMNGIVLLERLRKTPGWESVPAILVTALPVGGGVVDSLDLLRPAVLLGKPYEAEELLRLIQEQEKRP